MRYIEASGERLSVIGLGTWQFGSREWGYGAGYAAHEAGSIVARAVALGVNLFDTAEVYGFGASERILGAAVAECREQVFIATKVLPVAPLPSVICRRAEGSARRLGIAEIDLYQLHWPNPAVPLRLQMEGMRQARSRGLVRNVGVSNYSLARWQAAEQAFGDTVLTNQVRFSLVDRRPLASGMTAWAAEHEHLVMAYSPLAQGLLSGRYDADHRPGGMRANQAAFLPDNLARAAGLISTLRRLAADHDATPAQVALAWVVSHAGVVAIPGASSVSQLEHNAAAADLDLSADERAELTAAAEYYEPIDRRQAIRQLSRRRLSQLRRPGADRSAPEQGRDQ
ncbi:MAG TPA: aldo/keto reductase [Acidimicrobiales bacterium]|nr:aldo/keto reductase [Acidimicrobiales bacterium]